MVGARGEMGLGLSFSDWNTENAGKHSFVKAVWTEQAHQQQPCDLGGYCLCPHDQD